MGAKYTLRVDQGATFRLRSIWSNPKLDSAGDAVLDSAGDPLPGEPINLDGYEGRMQIRSSVTATTVALELTTTGGGIIIPTQPDHSLDKVRVATTANIDLSTGGLLAVDGVTVVAGDRVLVKAQTLTEENGVYVAAVGAWARAGDADTAVELNDAAVYVSEGTLGEGKVYHQTATIVTLEADPVTFVVFEDLGVFEIYMTDEQTALLTASGVYDVELESEGGEVARVLEGKVRLSKEITRV